METRDHYWQGEWIDDAALDARLGTLPTLAGRVLSRPFDAEPVVAAAAALGETLRSYGRLHAELNTSLGAGGETTLAELGAFLTRKNLERKLEAELGSMTPFLATRPRYDEAHFEAWSPLGLLVHVTPSNVATVGPMSVLEGLLTGNVNVLKTASDEGAFPGRLLAALADYDPSGCVRERTVVVRIPSRQQERLAQLLAAADGVAAWGGEEAVAGVRRLAPPGARVIAWGHKISLVFVSRAALADPAGRPDLFARIAAECCALDQQACSSPQCVYLETDDWDELAAFAAELGAALDREPPAAAQPGDAEAAELTMVSECHRLENAAGGRARLLEGHRGAWRLFVDPRPSLAPSPLYRSAWVKPLPRGRIVEVLRPMRQYLQTVGLACALGESAALADLFLAAGADRIRSVGSMLGGYPGEPHDGERALTRYCRRVTFELPQAVGIAGLDELRPQASPFTGPKPPVTPKTGFQERPQPGVEARLFFRSGGSTGEPKLSTYSYEQYYEHMRAGANGLFAAGFEPARDRAMNLFFGGGLYGGFISFFSALEMLRAVQFPMAAHPDHAMVARTIVKNRVNVLLGMPSYLLQLFQTAEVELAAYQGVEKIFYGGEHFTDAQKRHLRDRFGVRLIRSGAYGTVDLGPIGYQCEACDGGTHHLQQGLQYLEILKLDADEPVAGGEIGRLVFTTRSPLSNKPPRYDLGDVGHWVGEDRCPCGRASPRFRLLGRSGDIFRIGTFFLNFQKLVDVLATEGGYAGDVQCLLEEDGLTERLRLRIAAGGAVDAEAARRLCLKHYVDLREAVEVDRTLLFVTEAVNLAAFERTPGSGKTLRVIDRRRRA